ncbi:MAG: EAL domain-containing protein [Lachnospiraceae bacterium]|nr:EAL domain-containing protein [Lachnospiraceae bacterium]
MFFADINWNLDLDMCALFIISILMVFILRRQILPLRQNLIFLGLMTCHMLVALTDIVASVMLSYPERYTVGMLYAINIIYYCLRVVSSAIFLMFILAQTGQLHDSGILLRFALEWPEILTCAMAILTPVTHWVFYIDETGGFHYGPGRHLIYGVTMAYYAIGTIHVMEKHKILKRMSRWSAYLFVGFTVIAATMQQFFTPHTQTLSIGVTAGLLIMCLSDENPDMFRDRVTSIFDVDGLRLLYNEYLHYGKYHRVGVMAFESYQDLRSTYGDEVMNNLLERIGIQIRLGFPKDTIFYINNGCFLFLDEEDDIDDARERALTYFTRPIKTSKGDIMLSPCFAIFDEKLRPSSYDEMRNAMQMGLDEALRQGDGTMVMVTEEMLQSAAYELEIEAAIDRALKGDSLEIFFQPIYDTRKKKISSAEVLVRIRDEKLGLLMPDKFIGKSEENGSILKLGQKVFEKTCEFIRDHDLDELGLDYVEVNLSPVQCMREQLAFEFKEIVERYGVDYSRINLEITETNSTDSAVTRENMESLMASGMSFSLDDYGTGFSNLVDVMRLPLHIVKIDKSIVWAYFNDGNTTLLHVLSLFKESNKEVVCEGVETLEMAQQLSELGCDHEQGFYFSKPIPQEEFLKYLDDFDEVV